MNSQIKHLPCITPLILKNLGMNHGSIKTLLSSYVEQGIFTKLKRGCYINNRASYSLHTLPGLLFPESYITLDTVLYEMGVIRQASRTLYSISMKGNYEEILVGNQHLYHYYSSISSRKGVSRDKQGNLRASRERAFLDSLYMKLYSRYYPGECEYNLALVDDAQVRKLLQIYPERIAQYYETVIKMDGFMYA